MNNPIRHLRSPRFLVLAIITVLSSLPVLTVAADAHMAQAALPPVYLSPVPGAALILPGTTIAWRYDAQVSAASLSTALLAVRGTLSGAHAGRLVVADDSRTIIFTPDSPFAPGENVTVSLRSGWSSASGQLLDGVTFGFGISPQTPTAASIRRGEDSLLAETAGAAPFRAAGPSTDVTKYLTLPPNYPNYTVTVPANGVGGGYLFAAPFRWASPHPNASLLILDNAGQPVYYHAMYTDALTTDFKEQPNGLLTYYDLHVNHFQAMDSSYTIVDSYTAGNGYVPDFHELQLLPQGHALLMIYDYEPVDMSHVVAGGSPTATVIGLVVQELDSDKNVVFQWRSWDHFLITDTTEPLNSSLIDYVHGNALALDLDGNVLLSSRHMDEVTKINRSTGAIIWRLGGKNNQFVFHNDGGFAHQHDIRRLPNGDITLWDNHNGLQPQASRAVEYQLDETAKRAVKVWQYPANPGAFTIAMGDAQRLANGTSLLGWGAISNPGLTEVFTNGTKAFELVWEPPYVSYRGFRFDWHGFPAADPMLVERNQGPTTTLAYSWNGATEIGSYRVYGGNTPDAGTLLAIQPRTGFENQTVVVNSPGSCYFRVMPVDKQGHDTRYSNEVSLPELCVTYRTYLPALIQ